MDSSHFVVRWDRLQHNSALSTIAKPAIVAGLKRKLTVLQVLRAFVVAVRL